MMRRPPRRIMVLMVALLAAVGAACGGDDGADSSAAPSEPGTVAVRDNVFVPEKVEVAVGDAVTWTWEGSALHNVSGSGFTSETQKTGTYEHTFEEAGSYDYVCTLHPGMTGTVEVTE